MVTTLRSMPPTTALDPLALAIDGTESDRPALAWAAEEASQLGRPLLISHAVGHLSPGLGYAERRTAAEQRRSAGQRVADEAAAWVAREVPGVAIQTVVRLLESPALLQAIGRDAHAVTQTHPRWFDTGDGCFALAALRDEESDVRVLAYATDYARRRDVDLVVLRKDQLATQHRARPRGACLTVMATPGREPRNRSQMSWASAAQAAAQAPVVLVSGTVEP